MGAEAMNFSTSVVGRHATAGEIADVVRYLSSPQASWINGAEIRVDGGLTGALVSGAADFPAWR
jgi:NAD(P)-dependent dehydrogenase (short-subunit alcohol dehydrogenase family)